MSGDEAAKARTLEARAIEEVRVYGVITLCPWLFLASFTAYRRMILGESGVEYLHYGVALIQALVIAKVVLVGRMFGFGRRFEDRPLIAPSICKSVVFALLVIVFSVVEPVPVDWVHGRGALAGLREPESVGADEIGARILMLTVAFLPLFGLYELGRMLGMRRFAGLFFARPPAASVDPAQPA